MKKLEGYNSRVERLGELVAQLEAGKLNLDELIELESITRELHERSIILRYNAFKEKTSESDLIEEEEFEGIEVEVTIHVPIVIIRCCTSRWNNSDSSIILSKAEDISYGCVQ